MTKWRFTTDKNITAIPHLELIKVSQREGYWDFNVLEKRGKFKWLLSECWRDQANAVE
jgi:hypothetical protein